MGNEKLKLRRARSQARKLTKARVHAETQRARETANKKRRANGEPTPWEAARAARDQRRRPAQEAYAKRHKEDVLSAS